MGFILLKRKDETEKEISFCIVCFGVTKFLDATLEESFCYSEIIEAAHAMVDQVKVEGVDANLALMQELLFPFIQVGKLMNYLSKWEDYLKSLLFLAFILYFVERFWIMEEAASDYGRIGSSRLQLLCSGPSRRESATISENQKLSRS